MRSFGFEETLEDDVYYYTYQKEEHIVYWINSYSRIIEIEPTIEIIALDDTLYDLIKADMVVKE